MAHSLYSLSVLLSKTLQEVVNQDGDVFCAHEAAEYS